MGDELAGEDEVEADVVAEGGEHGLVVDQTAGRPRPPHGGRANSAARPAASVELPPLPKVKQPAAGGEALGHGGGRRVERRRPAARVVGPERHARRPPSPRPTRRGRRAAPSGRAVVAVDEGIEEVGALTHRSARAARSPCRRGRGRGRRACDRPTDQGGVDRLESRVRCAPWRAVIGTVATSAEPPLVRAGDAAALVVDGSVDEQARVLEAHMGQLPEHVVAEHEPAVVAGGRVVATRARGRRPTGRRRPAARRSSPPHAGPPQDSGDVARRRPRRRGDVTGPRQRQQRRAAASRRPRRAGPACP